MTPEQESQVFNDLGELKSEVRESRAETKNALNLITGNGRPEDGILYIMHDVRKSLTGLHDWIKAHDITHAQIEACIKTHGERISNIETSEKIKDAEEKGNKQATETLKHRIISIIKNPVVITAIAGGLATITGWNKDAILKAVLSLLGGE
ncbi:MAG TPA: hypothetical protein PLF61_02925 [Candidatus Goldiibacteriota bacterium]|nr:hypothetical protein [Candidatus Goldiibacteriota bacterium]